MEFLKNKQIIKRRTLKGRKYGSFWIRDNMGGGGDEGNRNRRYEMRGVWMEKILRETIENGRKPFRDQQCN